MEDVLTTNLIPPAHSPRYVAALGWTAQLHLNQCRKGKAVPYLAHLIAVSALVWEDGGDEDQAIAGLLHDAIEDAGQSHDAIADRFGQRVTDMVQSCTDTPADLAPGAPKPPWLDRKRAYIESLAAKGEDDPALLVTAADKAHNARDQMLDTITCPESWKRFRAGLPGSAWYLLSLHQVLEAKLPNSRSVLSLGESIEAILASPAVADLLAPGQTPKEWARGYLDRSEDHPLG